MITPTARTGPSSPAPTPSKEHTMATPDVTAGRPTGDSQSHEHLKRDREYSFESGGTTQGGIDTTDSPPGKGARGYSIHGGNDVKGS